MPRTTPFFHRVTHGIRITVRPSYLPEQSHPGAARFVFGYHVRIENLNERAATLLTRRWLIHDDVAGEHVVEGEGVVGEQPHLVHGTVHEYRSFCVLEGPTGWMEGSYHFRYDDGGTCDAFIPRFALTAVEADTAGA
jgi:ApaG protein